MTRPPEPDLPVPLHAGSRRSLRRRRLLLGAASVIAALLLTEGTVRVLRLGPVVYEPRRFEPRAGVPLTTLPGNILAYQPGVVFQSVYDPAGDARGYFGPDGRVEYRINRFGLRGPELPAAKLPGTYRVVCLGDSFTFGEGVREDDTWPARLQAALAASGRYTRVEVINAGVQAHGTREAVALYVRHLRSLRPDAVLLGFVLNDAMPFAETIRLNEAATKAPPRSWAARASRLWEIVERRRIAAEQQREFVETTRRSFDSAEWQDCSALLGGMKELGDEDGFRFGVLVFPILVELDRDYPFADLHERVAEACRRANAGCVDLLEVFRGRRAVDLWVHPTDQHPNEIAQRVAAEQAAAFLLSSASPGRYSAAP